MHDSNELRRSMLLSMVLALLLLCCVSPTGAYARADDGFCGRPLTHDFEEKLYGLPSIIEVPESGYLPFASTIGLQKFSAPPNGGRIISGSGSFGYTIFSRNTIAVNWIVESKLARIDTSGVVTDMVGQTQEAIKEVSNRSIVEFVMKTPGSPGSYRYDISFSDGAGVPLGTYSNYIRVVRQRRSVVLALQRRALHPGEHLRMRVRNQGTEALDYTTVFHVQRRVASGRWSEVFSAGYRRPYPPTRFLGAGEIGKCEVIRLPSSLTKGRYRVVKEIGEAHFGSDASSVFRRAAEFQLG